MNGPPPSLNVARQRALAARAQIKMAMKDVREGASPARLKAEASQAANHRIDDGKAKLCDLVRAYPLISCAIATLTSGAIVYRLKAPISAGITSATRSIRGFFGSTKRGRKRK